ncbi:MAG: hypothetical protein E7299_00425 [Lachnospiraceae bacterium]|nr:hypothetical protein [Lachnospiraceae bacterium]
MDISGLSSDYSAYLSSSSAAADKMNNIKRTDYTNATDDELMDACKQFEQYLVEMVMDEVMDTVDIFGTGEPSSSAMASSQDLMKDSMVQTMAKQLTEDSNLGIAQELYESMKRNYGMEIPTTEV